MKSDGNTGARLIKSSEKSAESCFRAGEPIAETGIYRLFHSQHRISHEVTLLAGHVFPRCNECENNVHFERLRCAPEIARDTGFRISLYEIPHPTEEATEEASESDELLA